METVATKLIPREVLFGHPERVSPKLSPDGTKLSFLAPSGGAMNLWAGDLATRNFRPVTSETGRGLPLPAAVVQDYAWAYDNRTLLFFNDTDGDENWRLFAVDAETLEQRCLTPFDNVAVRIVALEPDRPGVALLAINKDNPALHDVYRVDLATGELEKIWDNPGYVGAHADHDFVVRAAARPRDDGGMDLLIRDDATSEFRVLRECGPEETRGTSITRFTTDGRSVYMSSCSESDTSRLELLDLDTGDITVLAEDPENDLGGVVFDRATHTPLIAAFVKDRLALVAVDPSVSDDLDAIRAIGDGDVAVMNMDLTGRRWLLALSSDVRPTEYHLYDRDTKTAELLFRSRTDLDDYELSPMEPFSFASRDGETIHCYATFPAGVPRTNLPTVLFVHGGPWARDVWGFNPMAQLYANRGYLCVQVNYRGSTGYGKRFVDIARREWAGKMHDDLIDAVDHVVGEGWADRDRVAIYGGSYGGFAALVGATFTPDVFCCAVEVCGPSNLISLLRSFPAYWKPTIAWWYAHCGNPETEEDFVWSRSPLSRVNDISRPLLVVQTTNDPRVTQGEAEQIVAAMKENGIPHEYVLIEGEGHGFVELKNRLTYAAAGEKFLAKYLGGRAED